ncbi:MAG: glycoside hydrolase family 88 protein [Clostridia bacterium]|nr:glycoside hydrolase family 88 protein [Clostridia bacterium]
MTLCMILQILPIIPVHASTPAEQITACQSIDAIDAVLGGNLAALGLSDYAVLYNTAFSKRERSRICEAIWDAKAQTEAEIVSAFKEGLKEVITPTAEQGEILLFENFEKTAGSTMNGEKPDVGANAWTSQNTSYTNTLVVSSEKALTGTRSYKTSGVETGNIATGYTVDADSYTVTIYVYDNKTADSISNLTYDIKGGAIGLFAGFDINKSGNASWRGRVGNGGVDTNITYTDEKGNAIARQKAWNRLVFHITSAGTKLFVNGTLTAQSADMAALVSMTGLNIQQRAGWGLSTNPNTVYTDAVSIVKYNAPVLSDLSLVQDAVSGKITANVTYTDGTGQDPVYTAKWYVDGALVATNSSLSYTIPYSDAGKTVSLELSASNVFGSTANTVTASVTDQVFTDATPPSANLVSVGGTLTVGGKAKILYTYDGESAEGNTELCWYEQAKDNDYLVCTGLEMPLEIYKIGKSFFGTVRPIDNRGIAGDMVRTETFVFKPEAAQAFSAASSIADMQLLFTVYADDLGIGQKIEGLTMAENVNLCKKMLNQDTFASQSDIQTVVQSFLADANRGVMDKFESMRWNYYGYMVAEGADITDAGYLSKVASMDATMEKYLALMPENLTFTMFSDLPFTEGTWYFNVHNSLYRLTEMAKTVKTKGSRYYNDPVVKNKIITCLSILHKKYYNKDLLSYYYPSGLYAGAKHVDWAMIEFHAPKNVIDITTLLYEEMTSSANKTLFNNLMTAIDTFTPKHNQATGGVAGSNGLDISWAVMMRAVLMNNQDGKFSDAYAFYTGLVRYTNDGEGFHESDGSGLFHGSIPYTLGYCLDMYNHSVRVVYLMQGTENDLVPTKKDMLYRLARESFMPIVYRSNGMNMVLGRMGGDAENDEHISSVRFLSYAAILYEMLTEEEKEAFAPVLRYYANECMDYSESIYYATIETKACAIISKILNDPTVGTFEQNETTMFTHMARATHLRPDYGIALAMRSKDAKAVEVASRENAKGHNYAMGMHYIYTKEGTDQYMDGYMPTVYMYRMPGTTIVNGTKNNGANDSNIANGAVLDDRYAAIAFRPQTGTGEGTFSAHKSYFMFDEEIVCIGSEIRATDTTGRVETTVENRMLEHDNSNIITIDGAVLAETEKTTKAVTWAHVGGKTDKGGIGYYFPKGQELGILREVRTGKWTDISNKEGTPTGSITRNFFTMYKNHGETPTNGTYQYILLPAKTAQETENYSQNAPVDILNNNGGIHAVRHNGLGITAATFYNAAGGTTADGLISVNVPASVLVKKLPGGYKVSVADVQRAASRITVKLALPDVVDALPGGYFTYRKNGNTVELTVDVNDKMGTSREIVLCTDGFFFDNDENVYLWEDFEYKGGTINGLVPKIGSGVWSQSGAVTGGSGAVRIVADRNRKASRALVFDAVNLSTLTEYTALPENEDYTISLWLFDNAIANAVSNFTIDLGSSFIGINPNATYSSVWRCRMPGKTKNSDLLTVGGNTILRTKDWHLVEIKVKNGIGTVYIDGLETLLSDTITKISLRQRPGWYISGAQSSVYVDDIMIRTDKASGKDYTFTTKLYDGAAKINVKSNMYKEDEGKTAIAALYENNVLLSVKTVRTTDIAADREIMFDLPAGANREIRYMVWNSVGGLLPMEGTTMQNTNMQTSLKKEDVISVITKVNDWFIANNPDPGSASDITNEKNNPANGWAFSVYMMGNMAAYEATGKKAYADYGFTWANKYGWKVYGTNEGTQNADSQACLVTYYKLYRIDPARADLTYLNKNMEASLANGAVSHWSWVDAAFMMSQLYGMLYEDTGDSRYIDRCNRMFKSTMYSQSLYDPTEGLMFRDAKFFYPDYQTAIGTKDFWGRGNGWGYAATTRIFEYIPEEHEDREKYLDIIRTMGATLKKTQQADGFWRASILDPITFTQPETSGTALLTYGLAKAINHGWLDSSYIPVVEKAWEGMLREAIYDSGKVGHAQPGGDRAAASPKENTNDFTVGAFLLCGTEVAKLAK